MPGPAPERIRALRVQVQSNLSDNLMPFWANHAFDAEHGGFLTRLDRRGNVLDTAEKILIMQVRMIAALSMAHTHGLDDRGYLDLAANGFHFVVEHFWDHANGGYYFSTLRDGTLKCTRKNTDFHAYALIGLCEYHRASDNPAALQWAEKVYDVLQRCAADGDLGYIEDFDGEPWPALNDEQMGLGGRQDIKTIDMHTNMLEGLTYLARRSGKPQHRDALHAVLRRIVEKGIDPATGATITAFDRHWNPVPDGQGHMTTSYGINVELAWLMLEAIDVLGLARDDYRGIVLRLVDHALEFGFDHERGGLVGNGPMTGSIRDAEHLGPDRFVRPWWAQAELLNALIDLYTWTRNEKYWTAFEKEIEWIWSYQIDHECGDWYQDVDGATRTPLTTEKGREWKTAFHAARALIRVADSLERLT